MLKMLRAATAGGAAPRCGINFLDEPSAQSPEQRPIAKQQAATHQPQTRPQPNAQRFRRGGIEATDQQVRAARIAAEGVLQEQRVGLRTTIDVLNAEQELRAAELSQVSARRDEYVAAAGVLSQVGRLQAGYLVPEVSRYDPAANFNSLRVTWGWVPWEVPISGVDGILTPKPVVIPDRPIPVAPASLKTAPSR